MTRTIRTYGDNLIQKRGFKYFILSVKNIVKFRSIKFHFSLIMLGVILDKYVFEHSLE